MKTRRALIFWGGWPGHMPEPCARTVADMLGDDGFDVAVEPGTACLAAGPLDGFDLIVPMVTAGQIADDELAALEAAIRGGVGLAGCHGGMGDSFREATDYQFMIGGQFVAHPGNIIDYRVEIARTDDPIVAGIGDFAYRSEQYYMHVDPSNAVLAETRFDGAHGDWIAGVRMPVIWKRRHGAGRVFYSALGHSAEELAHPQARTILRRGMVWAARP